MAKRIFIGIPATEEIKRKVDEFRRQQADLVFARWISPRNLHITLVPPWKIMEHETWNIEQKLNSINFKPFEIVFNKISLGPNLREPRLIWASGTAVPQIQDLRLKIYEALHQDFDNRPFNMHMTLARCQRASLPSLAKMLFDINWRIPVDRFVLYESFLLPEGAEYEILAEFALKS